MELNEALDTLKKAGMLVENTTKEEYGIINKYIKNEFHEDFYATIG